MTNETQMTNHQRPSYRFVTWALGIDSSFWFRHSSLCRSEQFLSLSERPLLPEAVDQSLEVWHLCPAASADDVDAKVIDEAHHAVGEVLGAKRKAALAIDHHGKPRVGQHAD